LEKTFVTLERFKDLKQEIKNLKSIGRKKIADKLSQFRDSVDLIEDSSYNEILLEQANLEGRIEELEHVLEQATIIRERKSSKIRVGSTVVVRQSGNSKKVTLKIVGSIDADPAIFAISNECPLGQALLGKKKNEHIEIAAPNGTVKYTILEIK